MLRAEACDHPLARRLKLLTDLLQPPLFVLGANPAFSNGKKTGIPAPAMTDASLLIDNRDHRHMSLRVHRRDRAQGLVRHQAPPEKRDGHPFEFSQPRPSIPKSTSTSRSSPLGVGQFPSARSSDLRRLRTASFTVQPDSPRCCPPLTPRNRGVGPQDPSSAAHHSSFLLSTQILPMVINLCVRREPAVSPNSLGAFREFDWCVTAATRQTDL